MRSNIPLMGLCALLSVGFVAPTGEAQASTLAVNQDQEAKAGLKRRIAVGRFTNSTPYGRLLLAPGAADPIATQASDMLSSALVSTGHFFVFERADIAAIAAERELSNISNQNLVGVDTLLMGSITQLGRRNEGKSGFLNSQRRQAVNATVEIRLVDVRTGHVFFTASGAGEATTETGEVAGFGTRAGYDATLNDRAISAAIADSMNTIINQLQQRPWFTDILRANGDSVFISGGASQGLKIGDRFAVETPGEVITSGQSGLPITLPGSRVAEIEIKSFFGAGPDSEGAVAQVISGSVPSNLSGLRVVQP